MVLGKMIEITLLLVGIAMMWHGNKSIGVFLTFLIMFDWLFSPFVEKRHCNDYLYSWKCLLNLEKSEKSKI